MTDHLTINRRDLIGAVIAAGALAGCAGPAALGAATPARPASSNSASGATRTAARALYDRLLSAYLTDNPETATSLGLDIGERAALRGRLTESGSAQRFGFAATLAAATDDINRLDVASLSGQERTYLDVIRWFAARAGEIVRAPYGGFDGYPVPYTLSQLTGSYQGTPDFLDSTHPVTNAADAEAWLERMGHYARNIDAEVARSEAEAAMGVVPPAYILAKAIGQTDAALGVRGAANGMSATLARKAAAAGLTGDWGGRAAALVDGPIAAALQRQRSHLARLQPTAVQDAGVSRLPGGAEFYQSALAYHTSTRLTATEAHARGLEEVRDYEGRLDPLLRAAGLTTGSVGERLRALNARPDQLWPNTDEGRAAILAFCNQRNDAMRPLLARVFNNPPAAALDIRRVPPAIEVGAPRGYAQRGSLDGSRPGAFYINLRDTTIWPRYSVPTFVYHEGVPGHVFQGAFLLAAGGTPVLHRTLGIAAYGEGWGLYAEQVADELGAYADEPLGRIGYLQAALYRAVRIVVDTGMHALGWSRERAIRMMAEVAGLPAPAAESEIDRYIVWPAQATSYKLGHSEIVRARSAAQATMGSRFDIKGFHDVVLKSGSQPLELLAANVAAWAAGGNGAG